MERDSIPIAEENSNSPLANSHCSFCCFGSRRSTPVTFPCWERVRATSFSDSGSETNPIASTPGDRWWSRGFMKLREWSEIVAGPRWKTFIRRFNRNRSGGFRHAAGKYQYDPLSYAMNFDEGQNGVFDDDDGFRDFSARYVVAAPNFKAVGTDSVNKSGMELSTKFFGGFESKATCVAKFLPLIKQAIINTARNFQHGKEEEKN